jgi:hypothetical protein
MKLPPLARRLFDLVWERLAFEGLADAKGGAEYRRALADWTGAHQNCEMASWLSGWLACDNQPPNSRRDAGQPAIAKEKPE